MTTTAQGLENARAHVKAMLAVIKATAGTVKEVGRAPVSPLFMALQEKGLTYTQCVYVVDILVSSKLVKQEGQELVWVGYEQAQSLCPHE